MAITCSHCGEELLGAVNRCWKCGREMVSLPGVAEAPPIRRAPVTGPLDLQPGAAPVSAEIVPRVVGGKSNAEMVASDEQGNGGFVEPAPIAAEPETATASLADGKRNKRRGSPFAAPEPRSNGRAAAPPSTPPTPNYRPAAPVYPRHSAAVGGAIASLVLGLISLIGSFFTVSVLITAVLGLALGYWGLYCERRMLAIAGLMFCCIALAIGGFNGVVELYTILNDGVGPFDQDPLLIEDPSF